MSMSILTASIVSAGLSGSSCLLVGWYYGKATSMSPDEMRRYFDGEVAVEEQQKLRDRLVAENTTSRRRSVPRPDAGQPARVSRVRVNQRELPPEVRVAREKRRRKF